MPDRPRGAQPVASFWLMPAQDDADWLSDIVRELAARHGAPAFAPHLTIAGDVAIAPEAAGAQLEATARATQAFDAPIAELVTSLAYYRSFYARFERSAPLDALKRAAIAAGLGGAMEGFTPHVSLLYGQPDPAAKAASAAAIARMIVGRRVRFDRLAVTTSSDATPIADWRIVDLRVLGV